MPKWLYVAWSVVFLLFGIWADTHLTGFPERDAATIFIAAMLIIARPNQWDKDI